MNENQTVENNTLFHLLTCLWEQGLRLQPQLPGATKPGVVLSDASGWRRPWGNGGGTVRANRYEGEDDVGHTSKIR